MGSEQGGLRGLGSWGNPAKAFTMVSAGKKREGQGQRLSITDSSQVPGLQGALEVVSGCLGPDASWGTQDRGMLALWSQQLEVWLSDLSRFV